MDALRRLIGRVALLMALLLFQQECSFATGLPQVAGLDGAKGQLQVDSSVELTDKYTDSWYLGRIDTPYAIKNIISLKINESSPLFLRDSFTVSIRVKLVYYKYLSGTADSSIDTLTLHYDSTGKYQNISNFVFKGAHKVKMQILSVWSSVSWNALPALQLLDEMDADPSFNFACTSDSVHNITYSTDSIPTQGELYVSWEPDPTLSADQYDLEWTYVDSSALADSSYGNPNSPNLIKIFENNATRITTTASSYMVPLIFDDTGSLFIRVRPVQLRRGNAVINGPWSYFDSVRSTICRFNYGGHERKLNWQSTITFAEEGKRKIVVQYYDGSLRGRQTVTKDNTTNTTIVAENLYDYQGRPVIQVLPAPTLSSIIQYSENFNVAGLNGMAYDASTVPYDKSIYDTLPSPAAYCNTGAPPMDTANGASKYYSRANPLRDVAYNKFIPDAKGYVFTETQYEQDNTGRIAAQGGVGPEHAIGSGHETKYYYGSPGQSDLDALFGTEAGDNLHYFKNMVSDANGQYSVSYVDMHGRIVATALAGQSPSVMQTLPSNITDTVTEAIADSSTNLTTGISMQSQKSLLVSSPGNNIFHYDLTPQNLKLPDCNGDSICYHCLYNLDITITDDCNNEKIGGSPIHIDRSNFTIGSIDTTCAAATAFSVDTTIFLQTGNYEITKTLTVSNYGQDYYLDTVFLIKNTCRNLQQFIHQQDSIFDVQNAGNCTPTCAACEVGLGSEDSFRLRFFIGAGIALSDTAAYRDEATAAYSQAVADCDDLCGNTSEVDATKTAMLLDMSPPSGQYANLDSATDKYSIFYTLYSPSDPDIVTKAPPYQDKTITYLNALGQPDSVFDDATQTMVIPQDLDPQEFVQKFQASWANALLPLHPEYCKLQKYEAHDSSFLWDTKFQNINTYADAVAQGYFTPVDGTVPDPLIHAISPFSGFPYEGQLEDSLNNFHGLGLSLKTIACMMTECGSVVQGSTDTTCLHEWRLYAFDSTRMCTGDLNMAWLNFRQIYLEIQRNIIYKELPANCSGEPTTTQLSADHHSLNFYNATTAMSQNGMGSFLVDDSTSANAAGSAVADSIGTNYSANCQAYVSQWVQQLAPCNYSEAALNDTIMPMLLQVCEKGADASHPYGASTISPDSTNTDSSFEEVLDQYNAAHGITNSYVCNPELITEPQPYDQQQAYSDVTIYGPPDSCQCSVITSLYNEYKASASIHPDSAFYAYVQRTRNTTMKNSDLLTLIAECDSSSPACKFLPSPITLPPALQCNVGTVCANCSLVAFWYRDYLLKYGLGYVPQALSADSTDSVQLKKDQLFADYMNNHLGFNYQYFDYLTFMDTCKVNTSNPYCDTCGCYDSIPANYQDTTVSICWGQYKSNGYTDGGAYIYPPSTDTAATLDSTGVPIPGNTLFWKSDLLDTLYGRLNNCGVWLCDAAPDFFPYDEWIGFSQPIYIPVTDTFFIGMGSDNQMRLTIDGKLFKELVEGVSPINPTLHTDEVPFIWWYVNPVYLTKGYHIFNFQGWNDESIASFGAEIYHLTRSQFFSADSATLVDSTIFSTKQISGQEFVAGYSCPAGYTLDSSLQDGSYVHSCKVQVACPLFIAYDTTVTALLCGKSTPVYPTVPFPQADICSDSTDFAVTSGTDMYNAYSDSLNNLFDSSYRHKCLNAYKYEHFTVKHALAEYHYTLYYYDQAGNLVKTVPPKGVIVDRDTNWIKRVDLHRTLQDSVLIPDDSLVTQYRYNTLNQVIAQQSPDGGLSHFWYDRLGRLAISQNAKQSSVVGGRSSYSYTLYDSIGRITEVGEITSDSAMTDSISRAEVYLNTWISAAQSTKTQITQTVYDTAYGPVQGVELTANNLRNRVAYTMYYNTAADMGAGGQATATYYSYDIEGNVDTLLQDYNQGAMQARNRFKKLVYNYDLVSGKVNTVAYQPGEPDAFYHQYLYDAENRIINVLTSHDSLDWDNDAYYQYYKHGPLARTVIGQQQVQGIDYLYTLQGWLKAVNPTTLQLGDSSSCGSGTAVNDLTVNARQAPNPPTYTARRSITFEDGWQAGSGSDTMWAYTDSTLTTCANTQPIADPDDSGTYVAKDAYHFVLNYNDSDYAPIGTGITSPSLLTAAQLGSDSRPLYNGNITSMGVSIPLAPASAGAFACVPVLYNYQYDQLNRLVAMDAYNSNDTWSALDATGNYKERFSYDADGGIQTLLRHGYNKTIDSAAWNYYAGTHKLEHINDPAGRYGFDAGVQSANNYTYDSIGEMTSDAERGLTDIEWNMYGKVTKQTFSSGQIIDYTYDAAGNTISKTVSGGSNNYSEYYVRDASGNVMSIYRSEHPDSLYQVEVDIYGSSRLGLWKPHFNMGVTPDTAWIDLPGLGKGYYVNFRRGDKQYFLLDHRNNNMVVVGDSKVQVSKDDTTIDHYNPLIVSAQDYSSFGSLLDNRQYGDTPRYTYNEKQLDKETGWQEYGMRDYLVDEPIFASVDPLTRKYPWYSPYQFAGNSPIGFIDRDGLEPWIIPGTTSVFYGPYSSKYIESISAEAAVVVHSNIIARLPADEVNPGLMQEYGYSEPPIQSGTTVTRYIANPDRLLARLTYNTPEGPYPTNNPQGDFLADPNQLSGLSTAEIQDQWALPGKPTGFKLVDAGNQEIEVSIVGKNKFGEGGKRQFRLMENDDPSIFSEESYPLSESELFPLISSDGTPTPYIKPQPETTTGSVPVASSPSEPSPSESPSAGVGSSPTEGTSVEVTTPEAPIVDPIIL